MRKTATRVWLLVLLLAATVSWMCWSPVAADRDALIILAGDHGLPGMQLFPRSDDVHAFANRVATAPGDVRLSQVRLIAHDNTLACLLGLFLGLGIAIARDGGWRRCCALAVLTTVGAVTIDLIENQAHLALTAAAPDSRQALAITASLLTSVKFVLWSIAIVATAAGLLRRVARPRAWGRALFIDLPALADSAWRHLDNRLHREFIPGAPHPAFAWSVPRSPVARPCFWWFAITLAFIGLGPTWIGECPAVGRWLVTHNAWFIVPAAIVAVLVAVAPLVILWRRRRSLRRWIIRRFRRARRVHPGVVRDELRERRRIAVGAVVLIAILVASAISGIEFLLYDALANSDKWTPSAFSGKTACAARAAASADITWLRTLAAAGLGVALCFAFAVLLGRTTNTTRLIAWQTVLIVGYALLVGLALSPNDARKAAGGPYPHLYMIGASLSAFAILLTTGIAHWVFGSPPGRAGTMRPKSIGRAARRRLKQSLATSELFLPRGTDPLISRGMVLNAVLQGTLSRPLMLLLPPMMLALVANPNLEWFAAGTGFAISVFLLTWHGLSGRWSEMVNDVDRWFFGGTAFPVSLFVIVVGALRLAGVDYVTTILDAAPLGVTLALVVQSYVLSWLIEYWINRIVAGEVIRLLGGDRHDIRVQWALTITARPHASGSPGIDPAPRALAIHSLGRLVVSGTGRFARQSARPVPAFHSYPLVDFIEHLARDIRGHRLVDLRRRIDLYFVLVNLLLMGVMIGVAGWIWSNSRDWYGGAPLVSTERIASHAAPDDAPALDTGHFDLASALLDRGKAGKPALVVIASGGGTRAALYTAHVLEGLHRIGAVPDIVLASGVSGGGVALAWFKANYRHLTATTNGVPVHEAWHEFHRVLAQPFIQDVLEGATELRVSGQSSLSLLLAESFAQRLFAGSPTLGGGPQPVGLILNTTVAGHPERDSPLLPGYLDAPRAGPASACKEQVRPFTDAAGGRLIFTNLGDTDSFVRQPAPFPDARLPFAVVNDPAIPLPRAAALNANFPPVFPNSRVSVGGADDCGVSYFVTDGGVQENLSVMSALHALSSALDLIARCRAAPGAVPRLAGRCQTDPLPAIHFVLAEASATSYDYTQDRGIGTALSGPKDRLTGGLVAEFASHLEDRHRCHPAADGKSNPEDQNCRALATGEHRKLIDFHYLPLPLAFRARGGFGTHWMHANSVELNDPRLRGATSLFDIERYRPRPGTSATLNAKDIRAIWRALHDPEDLFCNAPRRAEQVGDRREPWSVDREAVRRWICQSGRDRASDGSGGSASRGDPATVRPDLHVAGWQRLLHELGRHPGNAR